MLRRLPLLVAVVLSAALALPALGARAPKIDVGSYRGLFYRSTRGLDVVPSFKHTVILDSEEAIERHIRVRVPAGLDRVPMTVIDRALGDECDSVAGGAVELVPQLTGFGHLGDPWRCDLLPRKAGEGHVVVYRPRPPRLDHRFALLVPIQPIDVAAETVVIEVEHGPGQEPRIAAHGWTAELSRKPLADGRVRTFVELQMVAAMPLPPGVDSISGRVPALAVTSGEPWDDLVLDHRAFYDAAARARDEAVPLAARVLSQPDLLAQVWEAARIALDEIELDPSAGRGGGWQLPRRASATAAEGIGTAADRAALLVAILRAVEIRAEVVLVSRSHHRVAPSEPLPLLNQTLVLLPDIELSDGAGPLFVDPSRSSRWLGALDEVLIGRDAVQLGARGARWLRLPGDAPGRSWTVNVRQRSEGFDVEVTGIVEGAPAARILDWDDGGRVEADRPLTDLAWLAAWTSLPIQLEQLPGGALQVAASGTLSRDEVLPDGRLPVPALPLPSLADQGRRTWPYPRDTLPMKADLLESWAFLTPPAGGGGPVHQRVTPFWEVDSFGSWSGLLFSRRSRIEFTGDLLPTAAAREADRFVEFVDEALGGVVAP